MRLIENWISYLREERGVSLAYGVRELNTSLGTSYKQNRIYEWRDGIHTPPISVCRFMLNDILHERLIASGCFLESDISISDLVDELLPPDRGS